MNFYLQKKELHFPALHIEKGLEGEDKTNMKKIIIAQLAILLLYGPLACRQEEKLEQPVADPQAASKAFRLYYRERVKRATIASQRFMFFGGPTFAVNIGKVGIARNQNEFEVVPGPTDNNQIGISVWTTYHAWRVFRNRALELALLRLINGLRFFEQVSGHGGLTARMVYPGWTMTVDGPAGRVELKRRGEDIAPPVFFSLCTEEEIISTLFSDVRITYRLEPDDFLFDYMPAVEPGPYAVTYSFSALPRYLRSSDCCCSLMRTPEPYLWQGAFWGNHNSRDNFPDLALGFITARLAAADRELPSEVRQAARLAVEAGERIGDLIVEHDAIMTADEHHDYSELVPSGQVRPDGETEDEDLGTLADCQMAFLARAISSKGLSFPPEPVRAPASIEYLLTDALGGLVECEKPPAPRVCRSLREAFCGLEWENMDQMKISSKPWLELVREAEASNPGTAEKLIGSFQDDFYEITLAVLALVEYADAVKNAELGAEARKVLGDLTHLMREFADIIWSQTNPQRRRERFYEAALFEAWAGLEGAPADDLGEFEIAESQMARLEALLSLPETAAAPLLSQEEISRRVLEELEKKSDSVKKCYAEAYGDSVPIRVTENGYQARGWPESAYPWREVERPHHVVSGGFKLFYALGLCERAPWLLDCAWARAGCTRADLNADGRVDEADQELFEAARSRHASLACRSKNAWCEGADLDHTGRVDDTDGAFMSAAQGCYY